MATCVYCKGLIRNGVRFCNLCGKEQEKAKSRRQANKFVLVLLMILGLGVLGKLLELSSNGGESNKSASSGSDSQYTPEARSQPIPTDSQFKGMSGRQHLSEAERLLALPAPTGDDLLWASKHAMAAKELDPQNHEAAAVEKKASNELAKNVTRELFRKADHSDESLLTGYLICKRAVEHGLRAPSTAKFQGRSWENAWHWKDHPGGVIANVTVDAQNSFGAYLRSTYECNLTCMTSDSCTLTKIYEIERP